MDRIILRKFAAVVLTIIMVFNLIPTTIEAGSSNSSTPVNITNDATGKHHVNRGLVPLSNNGYASLILKQVSGSALNGDEVLEGEVYVYNSDKTLKKKVSLFTASDSKFIIGASIAQLKNGGFVVVWTESDKAFTAASNRAFYQVYDNNGDTVGETTQISDEQTYKYGVYTGIDVTGRSNGGFAVVFTTILASNTEQMDKLRLVIYSPDGSSYVKNNEQSTAIGYEVNTSTKEDTNLQMYPGGYSQPKVVELSDGSFIVGEDMTVYKPGEQYSPFGTFMFKFDSSGNPTNFADNSPNLRVNWNGYTPDSLRGFDLVALNGGGFATVSVNTLVREGATTTIQEGDLKSVAEVSIFNNDGTAKTSQVSQKVIKNGSFFDGTYYGKYITDDIYYDNFWDTSYFIDLAEMDGKLSLF